MNFTSNRIDDVFLKMLFRFIDNPTWNQFSLQVDFVGREISREIGGGIEARNFTVNLVEKKEVDHLSPRDKMFKKFESNDKISNSARSKGGLKSARMREAKRRLEAMRAR